MTTIRGKRACVAPKDDEGKLLCGAEASTTRVVEGLEIALCACCAREYDRDYDDSHACEEAN